MLHFHAPSVDSQVDNVLRLVGLKILVRFIDSLDKFVELLQVM